MNFYDSLTTQAEIDYRRERLARSYQRGRRRLLRNLKRRPPTSWQDGRGGTGIA